MVNLTDLTIRSLPAPLKGQTDYFDDALPGFGVRISQGGTRSFFLFTGKKKNRERKSLGRWGIITLAQARAEAKRILAERTLGLHKPKTMTFSTALVLFEEQKYPSLRARTQRDYKGTFARHFTKKLGDYLAHFPALPGCVTWGTTYEEAVNNAREALTVYLESLDALGKPLPATDEIEGTVSLGITVRMPVIS